MGARNPISKKTILEALIKCNYSKSATGRLLNRHHMTIKYYITKYKIKIPREKEYLKKKRVVVKRSDQRIEQYQTALTNWSEWDG